MVRRQAYYSRFLSWLRVVGIDILGSLPTSDGFRYVLVRCDHFTKWAITALLRTMEAVEVAKTFVEKSTRKNLKLQISVVNSRDRTPE
jgi:hypothetical protein